MAIIHNQHAGSSVDSDVVVILESFALDISSCTLDYSCESSDQQSRLDTEVFDLPPPQKYLSRGAKALGKGPNCIAHFIDTKYRGHFRRTMGEVIAREESADWSHGHEGSNRAADDAAQVLDAFQSRDCE